LYPKRQRKVDINGRVVPSGQIDNGRVSSWRLSETLEENLAARHPAAPRCQIRRETDNSSSATGKRRSGSNRWLLVDWMKRWRRGSTRITEDQKNRRKAETLETCNAFEASAGSHGWPRIRGCRRTMRRKMRRRPDQVWLAVHASGEQLQIAAWLGGSEAAGRFC
jgi:hypothetical protein